MARAKSDWVGIKTSIAELDLQVRKELNTLSVQKVDICDNIIKKLMHKIEYIIICHAMKEAEMSVTKAAYYLGTYPTSIYNILERQGIKPVPKLVSIRLALNGEDRVAEIYMIQTFSGWPLADAKAFVDNPGEILCIDSPIRKAEAFRDEYHKQSPGSAIHFE